MTRSTAHRGPGSSGFADSSLVRFGPFLLHRGTGELRREGRLVPLRPLATRALMLLVREPDRLVSHEELRRELWGETTVAWSAGSHQTIRQIRVALDDGDRRLVETVPRRGYRFRATVEPAGAAPRPRREARSGIRNAGFYAAGVATPLVLILLPWPAPSWPAQPPEERAAVPATGGATGLTAVLDPSVCAHTQAPTVRHLPPRFNTRQTPEAPRSCDLGEIPPGPHRGIPLAPVRDVPASTLAEPDPRHRSRPGAGPRNRSRVRRGATEAPARNKFCLVRHRGHAIGGIGRPSCRDVGPTTHGDRS